MECLDPVVCGFILFCVRRRGKEWPALYDEMCWVAGQRLFNGLEYAELRQRGLSFALANLDKTFSLVETAINGNGLEGSP